MSMERSTPRNRECSKCHKTKPIDQYYKNKTGPGGISYHCKTCQTAWGRAYYKKTYDKRKEKVKKAVQVRREGPGWRNYLLNHAKKRALKNNIPFNITVEDIYIPKYCPVLGLELVINKDKAGPNSASIDRIVPELGYVKGNIQVISRRANVMKNDATKEELVQFADWIYKSFGVSPFYYRKSW